MNAQKMTYNELESEINANLVDYIALMGNAQQLIEAIAVVVDDHGGISPDRVCATHVENLSEVVRSLRRAASFAGVYARQELQP